MRDRIVQMNIERFRRLLGECTDEDRRLVLRRLLDEEEAKLGYDRKESIRPAEARPHSRN